CVEDRDDVRMVAELAHRVGLPSGARLSRGAHALGVVQRHRDLRPSRLVVGEIDALPAALAEEAPDPVAAGDLARHVGGQRLDPRRLRDGLGQEVGTAVVAEPGPLAVLVATGRTPHVPTKYPSPRPAPEWGMTPTAPECR